LAENAYPHLFEPGSIGSLQLRNRIVQSPMGTGMAEDGRVGTRDIPIQEERAAAGVG
jgi:2,4-dienoyl-CoA reductase-like NADH-dependent reductase (Old Yellow Enzyme family)